MMLVMVLVSVTQPASQWNSLPGHRQPVEWDRNLGLCGGAWRLLGWGTLLNCHQAHQGPRSRSRFLRRLCGVLWCLAPVIPTMPLAATPSSGLWGLSRHADT